MQHQSTNPPVHSSHTRKNNDPAGILRRVVATVSVLFCAGLVGEGCGCDTGEPYVDGDNELQCNQCTQYAYRCVDNHTVCAANAADAFQMGCQGSSEVKDCTQNEVGDDGGGETAGYGGCGSWSPGSYVSYSSQSATYEIEQELVDEITNDPYVLVACDSAYYVPQSGGYYALDFINTADLAYHLGIQSGDVILSINTYDLQWPQDYETALSALSSETEFEVVIKRNGSVISLDYEIVP